MNHLVQTHGAVLALEHEIQRLENGKVSVDALILEKQEQIKHFLTLIENVNEKGNAEGKPFKEIRRK